MPFSLRVTSLRMRKSYRPSAFQRTAGELQCCSACVAVDSGVLWVKQPVIFFFALVNICGQDTNSAPLLPISSKELVVI